MKNKILSLKHGALIIGLSGFMIVSISLAIINLALQPLTNSFSGDRPRVNVAVVEVNPNGSGTSTYETGEGNEYDSLSNGGTVNKEVAILNKNTADYETGPTLIRMRVVPSFVYADGEHKDTTVACDMSLISITPVETNTTDDAHWSVVETSGESYYYYSAPVDPAEQTEFLNFTVSYTGEIPANAYLTVEVLTEGISANEDDSDIWKFAKEAWEISSTDVTHISNNSLN